MSKPAWDMAKYKQLWVETRRRSTHQVLQSLIAAQVAAFAMVLDKDLADRKKTAEVDIGPLLTLSYSGMSAAELGRRLKHVPVAFYAQKTPALFD